MATMSDSTAGAGRCAVAAAGPAGDRWGTLRADIRRLSRPLCPRPVTPERDGSGPIVPRLGPLRGIRGVLFDVYGTLLLSAATSGRIVPDDGAKAAALEQALADAGVAAPGAAAELVGRFEAGVRAQHAAARARGLTWPEVDVRRRWSAALSGVQVAQVAQVERVAVGYECRVNPVWPMPGAAAAIAALKRRRLAVGIVSNAQFITPLVLQALLPQVALDPRLAVWSFAEGEAKPSPRLYHTAAARMARHHRLQPQQLLMVGNDLRNDVWAAQQAGLHAALFAGDASSLLLRDDDPAPGRPPDLLLTDFAQLAAALGLSPG